MNYKKEFYVKKENGLIYKINNNKTKNSKLIQLKVMKRKKKYKISPRINKKSKKMSKRNHSLPRSLIYNYDYSSNLTLYRKLN
jgi:hypothetical protein